MLRRWIGLPVLLADVIHMFLPSADMRARAMPPGGTAAAPPDDLAVAVEDERHRAAGPLPVRGDDEAALARGGVHHLKARDRHRGGGRPGHDGVVVARVGRRRVARDDAEVIGLRRLHAEQQRAVIGEGEIDGRRHAVAGVEAEVDVRLGERRDVNRPGDDADRAGRARCSTALAS